MNALTTDFGERGFAGALFAAATATPRNTGASLLWNRNQLFTCVLVQIYGVIREYKRLYIADVDGLAGISELHRRQPATGRYGCIPPEEMIVEVNRVVAAAAVYSVVADETNFEYVVADTAPKNIAAGAGGYGVATAATLKGLVRSRTAENLICCHFHQ